VLALGVGFVLVRYWPGVSFVAPSSLFSFAGLVTRRRTRRVVLLGYGSYLLVRGIIDVAVKKSPARCCGSGCGAASGGED
jgi:hypothetical protein